MLLPPDSDLFQVCAEVADLPTTSAIVTLSAHLAHDRDSIRLCAMALAAATNGVVLTDLPMIWSFRIEGEVVPALDEAWFRLCSAAAEGAKRLALEKEQWRPDADDDWTDVRKELL
jgi:hypothetical protein